MKQETFAQKVWGGISIVVVCAVGGCVRGEFKSTPAEPTIKIIAVDYGRGEYTAIKQQYAGGKVKFVAHYDGACPLSLGTYAAGPGSVFAHPDIIRMGQAGQD